MTLFRMTRAVNVLVVLMTVLEHLLAQEWSLRLSGGQSPFEGRVEVLLGNNWGTIRDTNWGLEEATVVCRQLGFSGTEASTLGGHFTPAGPSVPILISDVQCSERAESLSECVFQTVPSHVYSTHTQDAGVICAAEYSLRLVNETTISSNIGSLEVQHGSSWRPVCLDNSWSNEGAMVACRQLGYDQSQAYQGIASSNALQLSVASLNCTGNELHIHSCPSLTTTEGTCSNGQAVQLQCAGSPLPPLPPTINFLTCTSVTVFWNNPDNRGQEIEAYIVRYRPIPHPQLYSTLTSVELITWTNRSAVDTNTEEHSLTIEGLLALVEYEFQVRAMNSIGSSPFSDSTTVSMLAPGVSAPRDVRVEESEKTTATISWTEPMTCGIENLTYEISYNIEDNRLDSFSFYDTISPRQHNSDSSVQYIVQSLLPYTQYAVKVRVIGYVDSGDGMHVIGNGTIGLMGKTISLSSSFSDVTLFTTQKSFPSGSPQAFVAFLTLLQSTAHFQWEPVSPHLTNGIITAYSLSCGYKKDGYWRWIREMVDNSTFVFTLDNLVAAAEYECSVAAINDIGQGPDSSPILFVTPADLNRRPSAPRNVAFAIVSPNTDRDSYYIEATWEMFTCKSNFSCVELLGYVISCRVENTGEEVRMTLWLSDFEDSNIYESAQVPADPFTRYICSMASLNTYGVGQPGSRISVQTPDSRPSQSPNQLYSTDVESESVRLHWVYNETPKPGVLVGFALNIYEQDSRFPERNGVFVIRELYTGITNQKETSFSYLLMYLRAGMHYNVLISALTNAGEGPQARITIATLRLVPQITPVDLFAGITSASEPFPIDLVWYLSQTSSSSTQQSNHIGFIIHCYENITGTLNDILTHPVFSTEILSRYSATVLFPAKCGAQAVTYYCAVGAFNERGEGTRSEPALITLPCSGTGGGLSDSFLGDPYYSITFLLILLLLAVILIVVITVCSLCVVRYERRARKEERYSTVVGYDEGYISMAPSGSTSTALAIKSPWSRHNSFPSTINAAITTRLSLEHEDDPYNHYDEIPGERLSRNENVYDEIPLRLTPLPGRDNVSSIRSSPALQRSQNPSVTCPSIHSISSCHTDKSYDFDESQVTTMTNVTKLDNTYDTGASKLSTLSSEESLVKVKAMNGEGKMVSADCEGPQSGRGRTSGYVQVVTTKDGKRHIKEMDRDTHNTSVNGESEIQEQSRNSSPREQFHSYQNVSDVKRPSSVASKSCSELDDQEVVCRSSSGVSSDDFQLTTVTDSEV